MNWVSIPEDYLNYLRENGDRRIPYSDYGKDKFKPFFGALFRIGEFIYVSQVSHPKERHESMTEQLDFKKIRDGERLLCVVNLNYMFPVPISKIIYVKYAEIEKYRSFKDDFAKSKYIYLLRKEMQIINARDLGSAAKKVYELKKNYPTNTVAKRCLDFKKLEILADKYVKR